MNLEFDNQPENLCTVYFLVHAPFRAKLLTHVHTVGVSNVLPGILSSTSSELKESRSNMNVKSGVLTIGG